MEMTKAWDVKALAADLKTKGLDVAEDMVIVLENSLIDWMKESIKLTPSTMDDIALPFLELVKPMLDKKIDQIDGEVG